MNYEILNMEQRSEEWFEIRSQCITGTTAKYLLREGKKEALKIVKQKLIDHINNPSTGWAAKRGQDLEPKARELLNKKLHMNDLTKAINIDEVGFVKRTDIENVGCSPDGCYINDKGEIEYITEIKCFLEKHHLECSGTPDQNIRIQIQWNLWVTGAKWCYFVQYNPDLDDSTKILFITKIKPDPDYFEAFERKMSE